MKRKLQAARDDGWTLDDIWDAVKNSNTCYQLCNALGVYPY